MRTAQASCPRNQLSDDPEHRSDWAASVFVKFTAIIFDVWLKPLDP